MPSNSYHRPPPHYQQDLSLSPSAVLTSVAAGLLLLYITLVSLYVLPSPVDLLLAMTSRFFGPAARETLQSNFTVRSSPLSRLARSSTLSSTSASSSTGVPGGIWNTGNTCYQNSVLQALASLPHLTSYIDSITSGHTASALSSLISSLNTIQIGGYTQSLDTAISRADGKSWGYNEQQDAQEFLQRLLSILEKEHTRVAAERIESDRVGIEAALLPARLSPEPSDPADVPSPFEGLLAQRVGCLTCKYVESIGLSPFVTLSLPLPQHRHQVTIQECLQAYVAMEHIPQVDCDKCTLLSHRQKLNSILANPSTPASLATTVKSRLASLEIAIEDDDFAAEIPGFNKRHKVSSTKTKQVMISRAPQILALHANRSVFDPMSGAVLKNHAPIVFPLRLDLGGLGVIARFENISVDPAVKMSPAEHQEGEGEVYELRSVVCHFGGHHNGHYITFRMWAGKWWRISDHDV